MMASAHNKARLPGAIATFGLAVGNLAVALEGTIPSFHQVLQQPAIIVLVPIITLVTIAALALWARQGGLLIARRLSQPSWWQQE